MDFPAEGCDLSEKRCDMPAKLFPKCFRWDYAISVCDVLRPFEIGNTRGLNLILLNLTGLVALKEGKVEQF